MIAVADFPFRVEWFLNGAWSDVDVDEHSGEPARFETRAAAEAMRAIRARGIPSIEFRVVDDRA